MSSSRWRARQQSDPFVRRARERGWRSRAAFKLLELDERDRLLRPGQRIVDLGSAPGSWSQVAAAHAGADGRVVALDLLPMTPLDGVVFIQGDFRDSGVAGRLEAEIGDRVDLVLSDMAPNISGIASADQARSMDLAELAMEFALEWLVQDGRFVVKLFQGEGFDAFVREARTRFGGVRLRKPAASRKESREVYMVANSRKSR